MKKRQIAVSLLLVLIITNIFPFTTVRAEEQGGELRTIVIGLYGEPGFAFVSENDGSSYEGYAVEYLTQLGVDCNYRIRFHIAQKGMLLEDLVLGKCDIILTCEPLVGEYANYLKTEHGIAMEHSVLYVPENADVFYDDIERFDGMNIGICRSQSYENELAVYAAEHDFSYKTLYFADNERLFAALSAGQIDAVMAGSMTHVSGAVKNVAAFGGHDYYLVGKQDKAELLGNLDLAMENLDLVGKNYQDTLYSGIYGNSVSVCPSLTREQHEYVLSSPVIKVGYFRDFYPLQYTDDNGEFSGIARDFFDFYSEYTGLSFEYVEYKDSAACRNDLADGVIDLIALMPYYRDWAALNNMTVSKQYLKIPLYKVMKEPSDDITSVGVSYDFTYERYNGTTDNVALKSYNNIQECLDAVKNGEVDAAYINEYSWMRYSEKGPYTTLNAQFTDTDMVFSTVALENENGAKLIGLINHAIDVIPPEWAEEVIIRAIFLSEDRRSIFTRFFLAYRYQMCIVLIIGAVVAVAKLTSKRKKKDDILEVLAYIDHVTGSPNQTKFLMESEKKLKYTDVKYAIGYINIGNFKYINDFYGREQGDNVLRVMSRLLEDITKPDGLYARLSADRFAFLVSYIDYETLKYTVENYISEVEINIAGFSDMLTVKSTCGIYLVKNGDRSVQDMIDKAAIAEKKAREERNTTVVRYDSAIDEEFVKNQEMTAAMKKALENEEFMVYLQPKVDISTEKPVGCEALIRWYSPDKGYIPVNDFVTLFEKNGFITDVDFYVLERVCRLIRRRIDNGLPVFPINVNQSRLHVNDKMYLSMLQDMLNKYDIPMNLVVFEITESAFIEDSRAMIELINRMKTLGFQFSMDDFGSGYSSFNLLKDMPVDELKIDKEFLESTLDSEKSKYIIERIVQMAHGLDIRVVCEGVETQEQMEFLREIECDIIQGYYYSKPMPIDEYEKYLLQFDLCG